MSEASNQSWAIREMHSNEVDRIREIDVSESGDVVYKWVNGRVEPTPEPWHRPADDAARSRRRADSVKARLGKGGVAFGAFDGGRLVGFIVLQYRLADDMALLAGLWVSRASRRKGIATALTGEAIRMAQQSGAKTVYVSACPSQSALAFYQSQGFRPWEFVHREMQEREPEDIHMIKQL